MKLIPKNQFYSYPFDSYGYILHILFSRCLAYLPAIGLFMTASQLAIGQDYKIVFWNLENYYDTRDDPATADDEFTPMGERFWSCLLYTSPSPRDGLLS